MTARFDLLWEVMIVTGAVLAGLVIPYRLAMGLSPGALDALDILLTLVFSLDAVIRFRRIPASGGFKPPPRAVAVWLGVDVLAALPYGWLPLAPGFALLRLLKFARVVQLLYQSWQRHLHHSTSLRLSLFLLCLLVATHWLTCTWLWVRSPSPSADLLTSYIASLYFCITTLSTVGFGDITADTNTERLFVILMMLFGIGLYGFVIGNVVGVLARFDPARAHHLATMERINAFMRYKNLPEPLRSRLIEYYRYLWEQRRGYDESLVLADLPPSLRTEVLLHLNRDLIHKVPLFQGASEGFLREIALQLEPLVYLPGDYVFRAGDLGQDMYFISRGRLEVVAQDGQRVLRLLSDGDFFGEIAMLLRQPRSASVRALTYCDLYRLNHDLFQRVLANYPREAEQILAQAVERNLTH